MAYRSSSQYAPGTSGTSWVVPVPAGVQPGDIVVMGGYKEDTGAVTPPDGTWNLKATLNTSATARGALYVYWKRLTAADAGSYTFTFASTFRAAVAVAHSGRASSGDPFDGTPGTAESVAGVTTLNVSASPAAAGGDAVGFWTNFNGGGAFTQPTNYTERQEASGVITVDTRDAVVSGSTGNVTATCTITDFMKAFLGVLAADLATDPSPNPVCFPGFMAGSRFPTFMLSAGRPVNATALPYDVGLAGGTTYFQNVDGAVTPTGSILKQDAKTLSGGTTPTGALLKSLSRSVTGAITPAGSLTKRTLKTLTGASSPAATLVSSLVRLLALAGGITPSGLLTKQDSKTFTGSNTPAGALAKQTQKRLAATITPAGVVTNIKTILLSLAGSIASSSALTKRTGKTPTGSITSAGALVKQIGKRPAGSIASSGTAAVTRVILRSFTGAITPAGTLLKRIGKALAGSVNPAGLALKLISRSLGGSITPTGVHTPTLDVPQFNGTSTSTVTGLSSVAMIGEMHSVSTVTSPASSARVTGLQASPSVSERNSSTSEVSDG